MPCLFQHIVSFDIVSLSPRRCSSIASPAAPASSLRWRHHVTVSRRNMRPSRRVPELAELRFQCLWFPRARRQTSRYFPKPRRCSTGFVMMNSNSFCSWRAASWTHSLWPPSAATIFYKAPSCVDPSSMFHVPENHTNNAAAHGHGMVTWSVPIGVVVCANELDYGKS